VQQLFVSGVCYGQTSAVLPLHRKAEKKVIVSLGAFVLLL
jgi:hypothetical protein